MISTLYPKFREWSDGGSIWILSDLHFNDVDTKLMCPEWIAPEEQVAIINKLVYKNDTFICLGDVGNPEWIEKIKADRKILIMGNHDQSVTRFMDYFDEIYSGPLFISDKILLSHEPISLPFCLNIHGHDHNNKCEYKDGCQHINLAANVCGYTPVSLGKIIKSGGLASISGIHRITIDNATARKQRGNRCD